MIPVQSISELALFCFDPDGNEVEFQDYFRRRARETTAE
jgi:hypothetical protein